MNTLRECAEAAVKASGADGWQITGGTAHAWAVTLYFNRDGEVKRNDGSLDGSGGGRSAVVASEVDAEARGDMEVAPAAPRRMWKMFKHYADDALGHVQMPGMDPVTILPGHDAVEQIEREAYERGWRAGHQSLLVDGGDSPFAIDGVSPVVVDGAVSEKQLNDPW